MTVQIDKDKERARVAQSGRMTPESATQVLIAALRTAREHKLRTVLLAFERLTLTRRLSVLEAHAIAEHMAEAGRGMRRVAFLLRDECSASIGHLSLAAGNRGLPVAAFAVEAEALAWLDAATG